MSTIEELLPSFREITVVKEDLRWLTDVEWDEHDFGLALLGLLTDAQNSENDRLGGPLLLDLTKAAWTDLIAAEKSNGITNYGILLCQFLRLYVAVGLMQTGAKSRRTSVLFDGICLSLSDEPLGETERTFHYGRLQQFILYPTPSLIQGNACHTFLEWADAFFYYGWHHDTHFAWATEIFVPTVNYLLLALNVLTLIADAIPAAAQVAAWGVRHELNFAQSEAWNRLIAKLVELYRSEMTAPRDRTQIGILLTTAVGTKAGIDIAAEARSILDKYPQYLGAHEPLQLLCAVATNGSNALLAVEDKLKAAIGLYRTFLSSQGKVDNYLVPRYDRGWVFDVLAPAMRCALLAGETAFVSRVLSAWNGNQSIDAVPTRLLFIQPTSADGLLLALDGKVISFAATKSETQRQLINLVSSANNFLGTRLGVSGDTEDQALQSLNRIGVPAPEHADAFYHALMDFYQPEKIKELVDNSGGCEGYCLVPFLQHPLTALLNHSAGLTIPFSVSLASPKPDRSLRRAAIWCLGTYTGEMEADAVMGILSHAGVEVERFDATTSLETLIACYTSSAFDLIWIISHGEYNHYEPHQTFIEADGKPLNLEMLASWTIPTNEMTGRRLLVLNMCDGATTATLGGLAEIGVGALLAGPYQAVIGHLWPVDYRTAPIYGALLASSLVPKEADFLSGFQSSLALLASSGERVEAHFSNYSITPDFVEMTQSIDWKSIQAWGSPVFLQ